MAMKTSHFDLFPQICLSLATGPVLATLTCAQSLGQTLTEMGQASEEMFRGERLPILPLQEVKSKGHP
jgi:hypothetical protein